MALFFFDNDNDDLLVKCNQFSINAILKFFLERVILSLLEDFSFCDLMRTWLRKT